ncbi:hypothetical protein HID58_017967 [Brassica napus]|uniref:Xylanase inhibitor N-terminal domain-containing protein n=1 Tax=Brassica napus TaxID=3708 RepID=A0ABQ8D8L6_BRANA|nr:hypothetical protein HID58_017967 [Brassica napus]
MDCLRFCLIYCWLNTNQMEVKILSATIQYEAGFVEKLWQRFSARRWRTGKAIPFSHEIEVIQLKLRDQARYDKLLQSHGGLLNIPSRKLLILSLLEPFTYRLTHEVMFCGLVVLFAMINVLLCLQIQLTYSDPGSSVTTTPISCSDQRCSWGVQSSNSCSSAQNNICAYTFQYGDGSCTSGFFVSGVLHVFFLHHLNSDEPKAQASY